jgi:hypothetical protein
MPHVHVNGGTIDAVSACTIAGTASVALTGGTIAMLQAGTISSLPNVTLAGGTVGLLQAGTIDQATLAAGTAHIGQAGGHTQRFAGTPTLSTAVYASGDLLGTLLTAPAARVAGQGFVVLDVCVTDLGKQNQPVDVVFFDAAPSSTTFTDNSALDVADADLPKARGFVSLGTAKYCSFNDNSMASDRVDRALNPASGTLWYCLVARGTPTYGTGDVTVSLGILQD